MRARIALVIIAACVGGTFINAPLKGAVRSTRYLGIEEKIALAASEHRLFLFDQTLERRFARRKISRQDYDFQKHYLVALIGGEAELQDGILVKKPLELSEGQREVLENIEKYTVLVPAYAALFAAEIFVRGGAPWYDHALK